jgi:putative FmdB family regulatory protein
MPLYEYECEVCAHRFERIRKFSDPPLDACPNCGGAVRKLFSSPAIQFKGSGWYITDYARKPSGDTAKTGSKNDSEKASGDTTSSEKKGETSSTKSDSTPATAAKTETKAG